MKTIETHVDNQFILDDNKDFYKRILRSSKRRPEQKGAREHGEGRVVYHNGASEWGSPCAGPAT